MGIGVIPVVNESGSSLQVCVLWRRAVRAFGRSMCSPFFMACPSSEGVSPGLGG